jgi:hypothetical protein
MSHVHEPGSVIARSVEPCAAAATKQSHMLQAEECAYVACKIPSSGT